MESQKELIFDTYISAETEVDLLKMESVRQYMAAVITNLNKVEIPNKEKILKALEYCHTYMERCQATFKYDQGLLKDLEVERNTLALKVEEMKGEIKGLQTAIETIKSWS